MRLARHAVGWNPHFVACAPELWPLARAGALFAGFSDWPRVADLDEAFAGAGWALPVRFTAATPRRRRRAARAIEPRYDASIALERHVPTRFSSWHDFLNALVWATFPRAKLALHLRQHRVVSANGANGARTREGDALAIVDEGGLLRLGESHILFGHALHEHYVVGGGSLAGGLIDLGAAPEQRDRLLEVADARLADVLADPARLQSPEEMPRMALR